LTEKDATMKSRKGKLVLSALAIALLATPAFAKSVRQRHLYAQAPQYGYTYSPQYGYVYTPPPPSVLYAPQHGDAYTPVYIPGFGNIGSNTGYPGGGR
jgi:hypothetical protein